MSRPNPLESGYRRYRRTQHYQIRQLHTHYESTHGPLAPLEDANKEISKEHTFQVWMKDSTSLTLEGKIDVDSASYCLSWTDISVGRKDPGRIKKIYPDQTWCIAVVNGNGSIRIVGPAAADSWLFPVIRGRLTVYAPYA